MVSGTILLSIIVLMIFAALKLTFTEFSNPVSCSVILSLIINSPGENISRVSINSYKISFFN